MANNFPRNLVQISSLTANNSTSLVFNSGISSNFNTYYLAIRDLIPATNATILEMTVNAVATGYYNMTEDITSNANAIVGAVTTYAMIAQTISSTSSRGVSGDYYLFNLPSSTIYWSGKGMCCHYNSGGFYDYVENAFGSANTNITSLTFAMSSGNITSGSIYLYGVVEP